MKNFLKEERTKREWTQAQLAEKVQVSRQTIISIESNRYLPSVLLCLKIARTMELKIENLFELEGDE